MACSSMALLEEQDSNFVQQIVKAASVAFGGGRPNDYPKAQPDLQLRSSEKSGFHRTVDVGGCTGLTRLVCLRTPPELAAVVGSNKWHSDTSLAGLLLVPDW